MSEVTLENNELNMNDLMDEIEKSLRLPRGGEIVTGKVHQVTDKEVIVNLFIPSLITSCINLAPGK